jgi:hypothetical protein
LNRGIIINDDDFLVGLVVHRSTMTSTREVRMK